MKYRQVARWPGKSRCSVEELNRTILGSTPVLNLFLIPEDLNSWENEPVPYRW